MKPYIKNRLWLLIGAVILIFIYKTDFSAHIGKLYTVLSPVIISFLLAWLLLPVKINIEFYMKEKGNSFFRKYSAIISAFSVYIIFIGIIFFFVICLIPVIKNSISNIWQQIENYKPIIEKYISAETINKLLDKINPSIYIEGAKNTVVFAINIVMAVVILIYILLEHKDLKKSFMDLLSFIIGNEKAEKTIYYFSKTNVIFSKYFYSKFISSLMLGILVTTGFLTSGISYPIFFGIIVAFSNMIPVFGMFISTIPIAILTFAEHGFAKAVVSAIIITICQQIENNILTPKIVGDTVGLSGFHILVTTLLGGGLFGFWGLLICIPVAATLKMLFEELKAKAKK